MAVSGMCGIFTDAVQLADILDSAEEEEEKEEQEGGGGKLCG